VDGEWVYHPRSSYGGGGYKIAGGANGGALLVLGVMILTFFLILEGVALITSGTILIGIGLVLFEFYAAIKFFNDPATLSSYSQLNQLAAATVITEIVGLLPALEWGGVVAATMQYAFLVWWTEFKAVWL